MLREIKRLLIRIIRMPEEYQYAITLLNIVNKYYEDQTMLPSFIKLFILLDTNCVPCLGETS